VTGESEIVGDVWIIIGNGWFVGSSPTSKVSCKNDA